MGDGSSFPNRFNAWTLGAISYNLNSKDQIENIILKMGFELPNIVDIIEVMENYVARIRPPENIREKLDITYKIENQSVILQEVRPMFESPDQKIESGFAKATYVKSSKKWKIYWMRANLKWDAYEPKPEVHTLQEFVKLIDEDSFHCFKG